jgi:hypothetical protein
MINNITDYALKQAGYGDLPSSIPVTERKQYKAARGGMKTVITKSLSDLFREARDRHPAQPWPEVVPHKPRIPDDVLQLRRRQNDQYDGRLKCISTEPGNLVMLNIENEY